MNRNQIDGKLKSKNANYVKYNRISIKIHSRIKKKFTLNKCRQIFGMDGPLKAEISVKC